MPRVNCKICGKLFYTKPSQQKLGWGNHCSMFCKRKSQLKGENKRCFICEKEVYKSPTDLKRSKSGKYFCSKSCQTIWRNSVVFIGENHPNWKDGKNREYRQRLINSNTLQICKKCGCNDDRLLVAHHLDRDHTNNDLTNLVWLCVNCHYLIHNWNEKI